MFHGLIAMDQQEVQSEDETEFIDFFTIQLSFHVQKPLALGFVRARYRPEKATSKVSTRATANRAEFSLRRHDDATRNRTEISR